MTTMARNKSTEQHARPVWMSIQEVADELGVTTRTVRRWVAAGSLDASRVGPRNIRIRAADVDRLSEPIPCATTYVVF